MGLLILIIYPLFSIFLALRRLWRRVSSLRSFGFREESCFGLVANSWHQKTAGSPAWILFSKIRAVHGALRLWNKKVFSDIHMSTICERPT